MPKDQATPDELGEGRAARVAKRQLERHEVYLALLRRAKRTRADSGLSLESIESALQQGEDELVTLAENLGTRIVPRGRPKLKGSDTCTVYIDECGNHHLKAKEKFEAFSLAAVIIRDTDYPVVDAKWKRWKQTYLGSTEKLVHEPDLRDGHSSFYCDGDPARRELAISTIDAMLAELEFAGVVCVLNRPEYVKEFGLVPLDDSLPEHP